MGKIIFTIRESAEGGYEARALGVSIFTEADTLDGIKEMIKDAVNCHYDPDDKDRPEVIHLHFFKEEVMAA